jgi:hypothetical protein
MGDGFLTDHATQCKAFSILLHKCLDIQPKDELLVIYDESLREFLDALLYVVEAESISATLIYLPQCLQDLLVQEAIADGQKGTPRLPTCIVAAVSASTAFINLVGGATEFASVRRTINHTPRPSNCRLATIPGISHEILHTLLESPIEAILYDCERVAWILGEAHRVELLTYDSRDEEYRLELDLDGWDNEPLMSPGVLLPGSWGNVPPGETFCCPRPETVHGKFCINGSVSGSLLDKGEEVVLEFEQGKLVAWQGTERSPGVVFLQRVLDRAQARGDDNWNTFAEMGLGLNPAITRLTGNALFDEKARQTIHIAIGDNSAFGGDVVSSLHADFVTWKPTLRIDGIEIMTRGVVPDGLIDTIRASRPVDHLDIPTDSIIHLRQSKVGRHDGLIRRRLSRAHRVGYVTMADRDKSVLIEQACEALKGFGRVHISRFLKDFPTFGDTPTTELLAILHHYRALGLSDPGRVTESEEN